MTAVLRLTCGPEGCQSLQEAMLAVASVATFWILVSVALTAVASVCLFTYHGGDWPKGGAT